MVDGGSGGDIDIPAFLIPKHDANVIKSAMMNDGQSVQVSISWILRSPNERVEYELWTVLSEHVFSLVRRMWRGPLVNMFILAEGVYLPPREDEL